MFYFFCIRLGDEMQQRVAAEEQLMASQDRLKRYMKHGGRGGILKMCMFNGFHHCVCNVEGESPGD